jgi:hypothetical protein
MEHSGLLISIVVVILIFIGTIIFANRFTASHMAENDERDSRNKKLQKQLRKMSSREYARYMRSKACYYQGVKLQAVAIVLIFSILFAFIIGYAVSEIPTQQKQTSTTDGRL